MSSFSSGRQNRGFGEWDRPPPEEAPVGKPWSWKRLAYVRERMTEHDIEGGDVAEVFALTDAALDIVKALAALDEPRDDRFSRCHLCGDFDHAPSCPYRRAVELMGEQPSPYVPIDEVFELPPEGWPFIPLTEEQP